MHTYGGVARTSQVKPAAHSAGRLPSHPASAPSDAAQCDDLQYRPLTHATPCPHVSPKCALGTQRCELLHEYPAGQSWPMVVQREGMRVVEQTPPSVPKHDRCGAHSLLVEQGAPSALRAVHTRLAQYASLLH